MNYRTHDNQILTKRANKMPQGSVTIAAPMDTLKNGVAKEWKTEKYNECNMICPSKEILLLYRIAELAILTVNPNTAKTGTDLRIRLIEITQQKYFPLLKEIPGTMKVTT